MPLPTGLVDCCRKMLDIQIALHDGTKRLCKAVQGNTDKEPRPEDKQIALKLSDKQKTAIVEATTAINMLRAEGVAVSFPEVFEGLRTDMKRVQNRLAMSDVGLATQTIQKDIIETLKEMIRALKTPP